MQRHTPTMDNDTHGCKDAIIEVASPRIFLKLFSHSYLCYVFPWLFDSERVWQVEIDRGEWKWITSWRSSESREQEAPPGLPPRKTCPGYGWMYGWLYGWLTRDKVRIWRWHSWRFSWQIKKVMNSRRLAPSDHLLIILIILINNVTSKCLHRGHQLLPLLGWSTRRERKTCVGIKRSTFFFQLHL